MTDVFDYVRGDGKVLAQKLRIEPGSFGRAKDFRPRVPTDGRVDGSYAVANGDDRTVFWVDQLPDDLRGLLYRLPEVLHEVTYGRAGVIHWTEGEGDADAARAAGAVATTGIAIGRTAWAAQAGQLRGYSGTVAVVADHDPAGAAQAIARYRAVRAVDVKAELLWPPEVGHDLRDHLAAGGTVAGLKRTTVKELTVMAPPSSADLGDGRDAAGYPAWAEPVDPGWQRHLVSAGDQGDDSQDEDEGTDVRVVRLSSLAPTVVRWLWKGRIPFGKLTIIEGDPEHGKSLMTLDMAARVAGARAFPHEVGCGLARGVVLVSGEDDMQDTIVPRLMAAGATADDLDRIGYVALDRDDRGNPLPLTFPRDVHRIRAAIKEVDAALVVVDPVMAHLDEDINSHNDASTRRALMPLAELAQTSGAAFVLVRHLNKDSDKSAKHRGGGSIAFTGVARSVLVTGHHPDGDDRRVLARVKNNLHAPVPALTYTVTSDATLDAPVLVWGEEVDLDGDALLGAGAGRADAPELDRACRFIADLLSEGPVPAKKAAAACGDASITKSTRDRAVQRLGVHSIRERTATGMTARWLWSLQPQAPA